MLLHTGPGPEEPRGWGDRAGRISQNRWVSAGLEGGMGWKNPRWEGGYRTLLGEWEGKPQKVLPKKEGLLLSPLFIRTNKLKRVK